MHRNDTIYGAICQNDSMANSSCFTTLCSKQIGTLGRSLASQLPAFHQPRFPRSRNREISDADPSGLNSHESGCENPSRRSPSGRIYVFGSCRSRGFRPRLLTTAAPGRNTPFGSSKTTQLQNLRVGLVFAHKYSGLTEPIPLADAKLTVLKKVQQIHSIAKLAAGPSGKTSIGSCRCVQVNTAYGDVNGRSSSSDLAQALPNYYLL